MPATGSQLFVIGDVHGCAEELKALVHKLPLDQNSTILFLGDYVDRGPNSKGVIDTILDLSQIYKVIALKGNHEWLFMQYLANPQDPVASSNFILNGGSNTLASYSEDGVAYKIPGTHREFLAQLRLSHSTDTHFFVHAGVPPDFDFSSSPSVKTAHQMLWIRGAFLNSTKQWPKIVVHGHSPVDEPEILPNRINLDTGCVFGRRLTALNMSTGELTTVDRDESLEAKYLTSIVEGGIKRPQRFLGDIAVEIMLGGRAHPFRTVNFNQFGLLVFPAQGASDEPVLSLGQSVSGLIKPGGEVLFEFTGSVVRNTVENGVTSFGIKFENLHNLKDRA